MADEKELIASEEATKLENFKRYKGTLDKLYSDDRTLQAAAGGRKAYYDSEKVKTREQLITIIKENLTTPSRAADASEVLSATNGIYEEIIQYYTNIPLYRYTVTPSQTKKSRENTDSTAKYGDAYNRMISVVDGISIEVTFPKILQMGIIYGIIYLYADKDKSSETIETYVLEHKYCKKGAATNFGTDTVLFDFKYFDDLKMKMRTGNGLKITEDDLFALFPMEMINQYNAYLKDGANLRWQQLNPKFSAAIPFSSNAMPPKFYAALGLVDYDIIKANEITRSSNELEKILTHEIPHTPDGELMFEFEEAVELHASMSKALSGVKGLKLLTTFGAVELIELQAEKTKENKTLQQAYNNIFATAGMNPVIFSGESKESLEASLQRDAAYMFKLIDMIVNFYNLAVNNLYNFSPFEAHIDVLRISNYDEIAKVEMYVNNANFGLGKLNAVVAAGVKQKDITDRFNLEQYLELDKILTPLQSAYTSTPGDVSAPADTTKPADTETGGEEAPVTDTPVEGV